jgi:hypothetical protein
MLRFARLDSVETYSRRGDNERFFMPDADGVIVFQVFDGPLPHTAALMDTALSTHMRHEDELYAAATPYYSFMPRDSQGAEGEAALHQWGTHQHQPHPLTTEPYSLHPPAHVKPSVDAEQGGIGMLLGMDNQGGCSVDAVLPGGLCSLRCWCYDMGMQVYCTCSWNCV